MKCCEVALDHWSEQVRIVLLGDLHLGNAAVDEVLVKSVADSLSAKNTYWIDLGDAIDAINVADKRFDPRALPAWVSVADLADLTKVQIARYKLYFSPHKDNCLARLCGNHEDTLSRHSERDAYAALNATVNLPDERALGYSGFLRLRFRLNRAGRKHAADVWTLVFYLTHGHGGGKLAGAKALNLERLPLAYNADVYAMGHTHAKLVLNKMRYSISSRLNEVERSHLIMVNVGSFMSSQPGYAERAGYYPQGVGPVELWITPSEKKIMVIQ